MREKHFFLIISKVICYGNEFQSDNVVQVVNLSPKPYISKNFAQRIKTRNIRLVYLYYKNILYRCIYVITLDELFDLALVKIYG